MEMSGSPYSLEGKLVLVTGAGTGIGRGVAVEAARMGADVVLHYASSAEGALSAVAEIQALGRRALALGGDLTRVSECRRVVEDAAAFLGGLDGVVSNAGVTNVVNFMDVTEEHFDFIYHLNIRGEFFVAQQAVPHMLARGQQLGQSHPDKPWAGASIVNISSVHGFAGCPGHSVYAGTKGAINAFSRELAVELCPMHIRVNVIAPGTIEVPNYFKLYPGYTREGGDRSVPWGRVGQPEDVGRLAVYLLSDASEFMTGHVMYLDGGLTAKMALPD
jgi:NAD(P)-dependent dehydrogenase (short-subunit alcohol dehydrogenase family)